MKAFIKVLGSCGIFALVISGCNSGTSPMTAAPMESTGRDQLASQPPNGVSAGTASPIGSTSGNTAVDHPSSRTLGSLAGDTPASYNVELTDFARDDSSAVRMMWYSDANKYCQSQGFRLPTARELAEYAVGLGAKISETDQDGYEPVFKLDDSSRSVTDFYYNPNDYQRPTNDSGDYWVWSSSLFPLDLTWTYALRGDTGALGFSGINITGLCAVRCIK